MFLNFKLTLNKIQLTKVVSASLKFEMYKHFFRIEIALSEYFLSFNLLRVVIEN